MFCIIGLIIIIVVDVGPNFVYYYFYFRSFIMKDTNDICIIEIDKIDPKYKKILIQFKDDPTHPIKLLPNPYHRLCGVGRMGNTKSVDTTGKIKKSFNAWKNMIHRCYNQKVIKNAPTYQECTVCDAWLYYSNFELWWNENYYEVDNQRMCVDKDILIKGNKIYSPQTCIIVPQVVNSLFINCGASRGDLPVGVSHFSRDNKYAATISKDSKQQFLGLFNTQEEAFACYKQAKEQHIKYIADFYKDRIPEKLYEAMYKWEVEITD